MKVFLGFVVAAIICSCASIGKARMGYAEQKDATVRVTVLCDGVGGGSGSGVVVDKDRILTAYHVVACTGRSVIVINFHGGDPVRAKIEFTAVEDDIVQLRVHEASFPSGRVRFGRPPGAGDVVCYSAAVPRWERICGTILGNTGSRQGGTVVGLKTTSGNSGSGVYNLIGELVGIHQVSYRSQRQGGFTSLGSVDWPGGN